MSNEEGNNRSRLGWYDSDSDENLESTTLTSSPVPGETCAGDGPVVQADISASPQLRIISEPLHNGYPNCMICLEQVYDGDLSFRMNIFNVIRNRLSVSSPLAAYTIEQAILESGLHEVLGSSI